MTRFSAALIAAGALVAAGAAAATAGPAVPSKAAAAPAPARGPVREYVSITYRAPAPPLGACTAPSDADSASAFALAPWRISPTLDVTLSTKGVPSSVGVGGFEAALDDAIGTWERTDLPNTAFARLSSASIKPLQRLDGTNIVGFGRIGNAVGITRFWVDSSTGSVIEFDTVLNVGYPWSTSSSGNIENCSGTPGAFDVQAVLTHELGHPVGLEHVDNDVQTMYAYVGTGETRKRTLAAGDVAGADTKY
jgi:hypothetical protein